MLVIKKKCELVFKVSVWSAVELLLPWIILLGFVSGSSENSVYSRFLCFFSNRNGTFLCMVQPLMVTLATLDQVDGYKLILWCLSLYLLMYSTHTLQARPGAGGEGSPGMI